MSTFRTPHHAFEHGLANAAGRGAYAGADRPTKGLEAIEAHLLFDIPYEQFEVVVHPQALHPLDGGVF